MSSFITDMASAALAATKSQTLLAQKKGTTSSSTGGSIFSFLGEAFSAYQTSRATPATIAPAPAPSSVTPTLVIAGAAALGLLLVLYKR